MSEESGEGHLKGFYDLEQAARVASKWPLLTAAWKDLTGELPAKQQAATQSRFVERSVEPPSGKSLAAEPKEPRDLSNLRQESAAQEDSAEPGAVSERPEDQSLEALFGRLRQT